MKPNQRSELRARLLQVVTIILVITVFGTVGYMLIEDEWTVIDALYMTLITLTTVGFGEVNPLSDGGRVFTIVLLLAGGGGVAYGATIIGEYLVTISITGLARERRMKKMISEINNHYIVCGYGRVGQNAAEFMQQSTSRPVVVIDAREERLADLRDEGGLYILGDATDDDVLFEAGVDRAKGLLVCTGDDANNLFVVLSSRAINPELNIVARATNPQNETKMLRAGASKVISPYRIGGHRMANLLVRPNVADFLDVVMLDSGLELWMEELRIAPNSTLVGKTIIEADMRRQTGVTLVAVQRHGQNMVAPDGQLQLLAGDAVIVLGTRSQLTVLEKMAAGSAA